jgi:hypothetical protein
VLPCLSSSGSSSHLRRRFHREIVGDKLLYTTGVLATRYRSVSIMIGMAIFAKMGVAVAAGD